MCALFGGHGVLVKRGIFEAEAVHHSSISPVAGGVSRTLLSSSVPFSNLLKLQTSYLLIKIMFYNKNKNNLNNGL